MDSQYTERYLAITRQGKLITPGTFLAGELQGAAKGWAGRYEHGLIRSLLRRGAVPIKSVGGSTAYVVRDEIE